MHLLLVAYCLLEELYTLGLLACLRFEDGTGVGAAQAPNLRIWFRVVGIH